MGLDIIQSQNLDILFEAVLHRCSQPASAAMQVFQPQYFIVPSHGMGRWLEQKIAERKGVSANQRYLGLRTFQWDMYQQVLGAEVIAQAPQILNMKWRIFLFLSQYLTTLVSAQHPLFPILQRVQQQSEWMTDATARYSKQQKMLYWIADHTSRLFANYMVYRGQCVNACPKVCHCRQNWLAAWGRGEALKIDKIVRLPEAAVQQSQPHVVHYAMTQAATLEAWQRYLWQQLFAEDFNAIQQIDTQFWAALTQTQRPLPKQIYVFTVLELPPSQLDFLRRLAQFCEIQIFHYTPSQEYWADSVDPKWKAKYALKHPDAAVYYESRHPLLTRLGKQARDMSALLSQLSGGEEGEWQDAFPDVPPNTILEKLQSDILHLREPVAGEYVLQAEEDALQIHVCHSTLRQLEVLKEQLIAWLNTPTKQPRALDEILILVPNLQDVEPLIRTVFAQNYETKQVNLAVKIAGVPVLDAVQLWQALTLRIQLLQQRFTREQFIDYLSLLPIQALYQLNFEDIQRIADILAQAGFKRGFDRQHLQQTLSAEDTDYRFSLHYALQRLALAIAMPEHALYADVLSLTEVRQSDFELIAKCLSIYQDLDVRRDWLAVRSMDTQQDIEAHLDCIAQELQDFSQIAGFKPVQDAFDTFKRIIRVTITEQQKRDGTLSALQLPLQYVLDEIANSIEHQIGQTEPTGHITFAQIGQLRPLPYKLMVCLNLDMGTFPNRDNHIPFDLMELLRAELGDRSRLDDEQGAFLDALLQAQEGFWLFYNGFDVNDHEVRDPSSVVQELLAHLAEIVAKQPNSPDTVVLDGIKIPAQLQPLFHIHSLQPFDKKVFAAKESAVFASQWFGVAQQLLQPQQQAFHWLNCPYPQQNPEKIQINAQQWIKDLCCPAQHFLRHVGIANVEMQAEVDDVEPLQLNGLQKYAVRDYLQQQLKSTTANVSDDTYQLLQDKLPIGKMQSATLQMAIDEYHWVAGRLAYYGGEITPLTQRRWQYDEQTQFLLLSPEQKDATQWVSLTASGCYAERPLVVWLEYLLWRASTDTSEHLQRIALFKNNTLRVQGLNQQQAHAYLTDWLAVWRLAQQHPFVLPPALFANVLKNAPQWAFDAQGRDDIENYDVLEKMWLGQNFDKHSAVKNHQNKGCVLSPNWALLLMNQDAKVLLNQFAEQYAALLYRPLAEHIDVVVEEQ